MERRDLLKGLLGGIATVAVGSKVILSKVDAEELNVAIPKEIIKSRTIHKVGDISKEVIEYVPNPYMVTSTAVIPPHKVPLKYEEGDLLEVFEVDTNTEVGALVTLKMQGPTEGRVVNYDESKQYRYGRDENDKYNTTEGKRNPPDIPLGRVIKTDGKVCTVLIKNKSGWVW